MYYSDALYEAMNAAADESKVADAFMGKMVKDDFGEAVAYRRGELSYLPFDLAQATYAGRDMYHHPQRVSGKVGRIARQLLREDVVRFELTDRDFEIFASKLKASDITESGEFSVVSGDDIAKYYHERSYARNGGTLHRSCMRYDACQSFMSIYTQNPDACKMLVLINSQTKLLHGRALVWYTESKVFMDRIYGNEEVCEAFRDYATQQGWHFRRFNTYDRETQWTLAGKPVEVAVRVPLTRVRFKHYPYMDTFKYLNKTEGWVSNDSCSNYEYKLESTGGAAHPR